MSEENHVKMNYNQITDHIYVGTNFCCKSHFNEELLEKGITTDISLEKKRLDTPFGVDVYIWLPVEDHTPPSRYQMNIGTDAITKAIESSQKVYVHCKNGHGRAPTLVAGYLIKSRGVSPEEAVKFIQKRRPEVHLEESQMEALRKFKERVAQSD